jgi:hypothetical protein
MAAVDQHASTADARLGRAGLVLGALGLASAVFAVLRLLETWRVSPGAASHRVSVLGHELSYPAANLAAVAVLILAVLGLVVIATTTVGAARELVASRRFIRRLGVEPEPSLDGASLIADSRPQAFCAGLLRPRVYVSRGALELLDESALSAVLAHERHHARRHDPLRLASGRVLARALFYVPGLDELVRRQQAMAELSADESAVNDAPGHRAGLARAMLGFASAGEPGGAPVGIDPARADYLIGEPPRWRFPAMLCVAALSVIALMAAVVLLAGRIAAGTATLAPPFLSQQPCVVVLAMVPAGLGVLALCLRRRSRLHVR